MTRNRKLTDAQRENRAQRMEARRNKRLADIMRRAERGARALKEARKSKAKRKAKHELNLAYCLRVLRFNPYANHARYNGGDE